MIFMMAYDLCNHHITAHHITDIAVLLSTITTLQYHHT